MSSSYRDDRPELLRESIGEFSEMIQESGKFKLLIGSHGCVYETDPIAFHKRVADSVFVPNVITPNGDPRNEDFGIYMEGIDEFYLKSTIQLAK